MRGVLFEEEHAREVAELLRRDGFAARVTRERFAGEDDDEDQHWVVVTDAPEAVLDPLVEEREGWVEPEAAPPAPAPLDLPTRPTEAAALTVGTAP